MMNLLSVRRRHADGASAAPRRTSVAVTAALAVALPLAAGTARPRSRGPGRGPALPRGGPPTTTCCACCCSPAATACTARVANTRAAVRELANSLAAEYGLDATAAGAGRRRHPGDDRRRRVHHREPGDQGHPGLRPDRGRALQHRPARRARGLHPRWRRLHRPPLHRLVGRADRARREPVLPPPRRRGRRGSPGDPRRPARAPSSSTTPPPADRRACSRRSPAPTSGTTGTSTRRRTCAPWSRSTSRPTRPAPIGEEGTSHPVTWCQKIDEGRSWYSALGHHASAYTAADDGGNADDNQADDFMRTQMRHGLAYSAGLLPADCSPPAKDEQGSWSGVTPWPLMPINMALTSDGKVQSFGSVGVGLHRQHAVRLQRQQLRHAGRPDGDRRLGPRGGAHARQRGRRRHPQRDLHRPVLLHAGADAAPPRDHDGRR